MDAVDAREHRLFRSLDVRADESVTVASLLDALSATGLDLEDRRLKATLQAKVMSDVAMHFRPEFLNRIDESVVFHALGQEHIREIAGLQLSALKARLAERSLSLSISEEVMAYLADQGFDPVYGARPLKRAIQRLIENPLAESLLAGDFEPGDVIEVSRVGQDMRFSKAADVSQVA